MRAYVVGEHTFVDLGTLVTCAQVQWLKLTDLVYKVSTTSTSPVTIIKLTPNLVLSGEIHLTDLLIEIQQADGKELPYWIVFDSSALIFTIQVTDKTILGKFYFTIGITSALHPGWALSINQWLITIQLDTAFNENIPQLNSLMMPSLV